MGDTDGLLIAPHADDETLFAAFTCLRHRPQIVVVYDEGRYFDELAVAAKILGCEWSGLSYGERWGATPTVKELAAHLRRLWPDAEEVWAPAHHAEGHGEHNLVATAARDAFGAEHLHRYQTYAPRGQRTRDGVEVMPEPAWIGVKLRALSCYASQIENPSTRPWFFDLLDLREWVLE